MAAVAGDHAQLAEAEAAAAGRDDDDEQPSVEAAFVGQTPPPWRQQVTARSVAASVVLGTVLTFMSMRIGLTAGVGPAFNIVASLMGFFVIKSWTRLLARCGVASQPFTRQENVVLQTCVISCATLSFYGTCSQPRDFSHAISMNFFVELYSAAGRDLAGGFSTYLLAMTETVAKSTGGSGTGRDVYTLHTGKVMAFLGLVSFASLFCTLPLRKVRKPFPTKNDRCLLLSFGRQ